MHSTYTYFYFKPIQNYEVIILFFPFSDDYTLQMNPESEIYNEHHLDYFKFIGTICGMAVYHNRLIDGKK